MTADRDELLANVWRKKKKSRDKDVTEKVSSWLVGMWFRKSELVDVHPPK